MNYKTVDRIYGILVGTGAILVLLGCLLDVNYVLLGAGCLFGVAGVIFSWIFVNAPTAARPWTPSSAPLTPAPTAAKSCCKPPLHSTRESAIMEAIIQAE